MQEFSQRVGLWITSALSQSVSRTAFLLTTMAGWDESDPTSANLPVPDYANSLGGEVKGLRIGVPTNHFFERCDRQITKAVGSAIDVLESLGCKTGSFEFPRVTEIFAAHTAIDMCESSSYHEKSLADRPDDFSPDVRLLLEQGLLIPATYYIQALRFRSVILQEIEHLFKHFDVIVTPTEPIVAPRIGEDSITIDGIAEETYWAVTRYLVPFNLLGLPALSVPCGFSNGLPIGLQLIGRFFDEPKILQLGYAYEKATTWHLKFPEVE